MNGKPVFLLFSALWLSWRGTMKIHESLALVDVQLHMSTISTSSESLQEQQHEEQATVVPLSSDREPYESPKKLLPMFHQTGGVLIFLHVAKTGGTTIRQDFNKIPNVQVLRVYNEKQLRRLMPRIQWFLLPENNKQTLLIEIHGAFGQPMTAFQIQRYAETWRKQARENQKGFFLFTMIRDPLSFSVSHFKFFKHLGCKFAYCLPPLMEMTEQNLVSSLVPNQQCQYLARKYQGKQAYQKSPVTYQDCMKMQQSLQQSADWIGTTDDMQATTLPLLYFMITGKSARSKAFHVRNKNQGTNVLALDSLRDDTVEKVGELCKFDQYFYDSAKRNYTLEMWDNFSHL